MKKAGIAALRTVFLFLTFGLIATVSRLIFKGNLFDEEMLSPQAIGIWNSLFLLFIFESTVFAFNRHAGDSQRMFLEKYAKGQRFGKLKSIFLSVDFYIEFLCIALLSLILPLSFVYDCVGVALFQADYGKLQVMLVVLPILLVLDVFARLSVRSAWISDSMQVTSKKEKNEFSRTIKGVIMMGVVYCVASLVIPWGLPVFVTLGNLGAGAIVFLYMALALLAVALFVVAAFYVRAISKRKDFITRLKKYCREHSMMLSNVQKPYLSVFFQQKGIDFTLKCDDKIYDCKLVAGVFPTSPIVFSDEGEGVRQDTLRLFKINILHLNTRIDYHMNSHSEGSKKIVIVLPVPKNIYVSVQGSSPRPADTGETMGEYTLYNATGFLNALERGSLD